MSFSPIIAAAEAKRAFKELCKALRAKARTVKANVGWPSGSIIKTVYWHGGHRFWALPELNPAVGSGRFWCAYGTQNPLRHSGSLSITCEINPPKSGRDLRCAGVFLQDSAGALYIAHNGRVGGGKKGVGKKAFLDSYQRTYTSRATAMTSVEWPDGKIIPLLIVGKISSPEFLSHLSEFISTVETFKEITADRDVNKELDRDALKADREGDFDPGNARETAKKTIQAITLRRGQPEFRRKLLQAYGGCCAITGCDCLDALEAAHIRPYGGESTNHVQNGILLRSDLHTLFDIGKISIDPYTGLIVVAKSLLTTVYGKLNGKKLRRTSRASQLPNKDVLREHLEKWRLS